MFRKILFLMLYLVIHYISSHTGQAIRCELKGLVNNKVRCLLHDRGINAKGVAVVINGTLTWKTEIKKVQTNDSDLWKYGGGLDRNQSFFKGNTEMDFKEHIKLLMPGTQWCGEKYRETPTSYEDLTLFVETDKCCKRHDACSPNLESKETIENITNIGLLKRFFCDCEMEFYSCLKRVQSNLANRLGFTYFTIIGPQCFKKEYPITNCTKLKAGRCLHYRLQREAEKKFQWFDVPVF